MTGPERRPGPRRDDPDWLEVAAQQESAKAQAGAIALVAALAIILAILFSVATPAAATRSGDAPSAGAGALTLARATGDEAPFR